MRRPGPGCQARQRRIAIDEAVLERLIEKRPARW